MADGEAEHGGNGKKKLKKKTKAVEITRRRLAGEKVNERRTQKKPRDNTV